MYIYSRSTIKSIKPANKIRALWTAAYALHLVPIVRLTYNFVSILVRNVAKYLVHEDKGHRVQTQGYYLFVHVGNVRCEHFVHQIGAEHCAYCQEHDEVYYFY